MTQIKIFENKEKTIDLSTLVDSRMIIMANSGGGKSYLVRKILEESHGKVMALVIDSEGEFRTLREKYDFLLIGSGGDVDLNLRSAPLLARKLLELNVPTILDISDLKRNERIKYVKLFLEGLMDISRETNLWKACLVFLDEIHQFAGQQEKQESCSSVIDLATRGRKRGFCLIGATQRISKLHKDVVAELNNYTVGRTSLDIDMKRSADILGFTNREDMLSLRNLDDGEFYVFGRAISKKIEKEKVAQSKTTHPKQGMSVKEQVIPPTEKVKEIIAKLNDLPKEVQKELQTISECRKEIISLKNELAKRPKEQVIKEVVRTDEQSLERSRKNGFEDAERQYLSHIKSLEIQTKSLKNPLTKIMNEIGNILQSKAFSVVSDTPRGVFIPKVIKKVELPQNVKKEINSPSNFEYNTGQISLCGRTIYSLLFNNPQRLFTKTQIGLLTGYSHNSGGFNNSLAELNAKGLLRKDGTMIGLGEVDPSIATSKNMEFTRENLIRKLGKCEKEILEFLIQNPVESFSKEEIAIGTPSNYSHISGGFNNSLAKLNALNFLIKDGTKIKINEEVLEI